MTANLDDRSPMAKAMSKVSEIISICLLMVVPALIGHWIDKKLSTLVLFTIGGLGIGMVGGLLQLMKLTAPRPPAEPVNKAEQAEQAESSDLKSKID